MHLVSHSLILLVAMVHMKKCLDKGQKLSARHSDGQMRTGYWSMTSTNTAIYRVHIFVTPTIIPVNFFHIVPGLFSPNSNSQPSTRCCDMILPRCKNLWRFHAYKIKAIQEYPISFNTSLGNLSSGHSSIKCNQTVHMCSFTRNWTDIYNPGNRAGQKP